MTYVFSYEFPNHNATVYNHCKVLPIFTNKDEVVKARHLLLKIVIGETTINSGFAFFGSRCRVFMVTWRGHTSIAQ